MTVSSPTLTHDDIRDPVGCRCIIDWIQNGSKLGPELAEVGSVTDLQKDRTDVVGCSEGTLAFRLIRNSRTVSTNGRIRFGRDDTL